ncbi:MAG: tetratricopeptide repeat protein [Planctomycetes bacterium]|nr:tetratricopeptide repeat protein [Planctomycetota bacterium]
MAINNTVKQPNPSAKPKRFLRVTFGILFIIILITALIFFAFPASAQSELDKMLAGPDNEIDLARAALLVAQEVYPNIDIDSYIKRIDGMADKVRYIIMAGRGNAFDPDYRIRAINTLFFYEEKYEYDTADFFGRQVSNCFLNGIMDTKKGACFTMPLLYLCLTDRLGFPIYGVNIPDHFTIRYDDGKYRTNIETTCKGGVAGDDAYIDICYITDKEIKSGAFLRNLSKKEVVSNMIESRGNYYLRAEDYERAIRDLEKVVKINPTNAEAFLNLSNIYKNHKKDLKISDQYFAKAQSLGYNFGRRKTDYDLKYIESVIQIAKEQGIDTKEIEAARDKEAKRLAELKRRTGR